jgi:hypothetical protein
MAKKKKDIGDLLRGWGEDLGVIETTTTVARPAPVVRYSGPKPGSAPWRKQRKNAKLMPREKRRKRKLDY